jgi:hypothetical protein
MLVTERTMNLVLCICIFSKREAGDGDDHFELALVDVRVETSG